MEISFHAGRCCSAQACSATRDFSVSSAWYFLGSKSSCCLSNVRLLPVSARDPVQHTCSAQKRVHVVHSGELSPECGDGGKDCPDVISPADPPQIFASS